MSMSKERYALRDRQGLRAHGGRFLCLPYWAHQQSFSSAMFPSNIRALRTCCVRSAFCSRAISRSASTVRQVTIDRPLPDVLGNRKQQRIYFGMFCGVMALSFFGIIKYEAANSPIVTSTLAALRRSKLCLQYVGPNVRFASSMPWVSGSAGIAKPVVDFSYKIVGDDGSATVRFRATKVPGEQRYVVENWSITPCQGSMQGQVVDLVEEEYHPHVPLTNSEEPRVVRRN